MFLPTLAEIEEGAALVHQHMRPTPEIAWPLLAERLGTRVVVKHENHTPAGAFKVRGGISIAVESKSRIVIRTFWLGYII